MKQIRWLSLLIVVALLAFQPVSQALADDGAGVVGTGTIQEITFETDDSGVTTVLVTLIDDAGLAQKVRLSLEDAQTAGLIADNNTGQVVTITDPLDETAVPATGTVSELTFVTDASTGETTVLVTFTDPAVTPTSVDLQTAYDLGLIVSDDEMLDTSIVIDPAVIIDSTVYTKSVTMLVDFFGSTLGLTYDQLAAFADAGYGNGVITKALWMATQLDGDAALVDQILAAKSSGDYSGITLPDGSIAKNWGQLKKEVLTDPHQNLGSIMSGRAEPLATPEPTVSSTPDPTLEETPPAPASGDSSNPGNGNDNNNGNGNDKEKDNNGKKK